MLKTPVERGVITLKSSKLVPLECTMVFGPRETPSAAKPIIEERVKVAINPEYPEQTVMIGSTLTKGGHNKLCGLLQHNLDIFAWKPADMTGVPRHIVKHHLNVQEGCSMVRQKKRGQAADRNQAIQEEVGKLVGAGIMREVHYHDWLSNPVMVKKHDDSWRMCVDFKDLNKACPKDEKSLPFFKTLKKCTKKSDFHWTTESEEAFKQMKQLIAELPLPTAPMEKEELIVYLAAAKETVTAVLMTKREAKQIPIYFVSRVLKLSELNYTSMEKLVLALVHASKRLKRIRIAEQMGVKNLQENVDSRLVDNQVNETYVAKEADMIRYLKNVKALIGSFKAFSIKQIPRSENKKADALSKIASTSFAHLKVPGKVRFLIVAMDYFTKWIEAKPVTTITGNQIKKFVWENVVCRFGLPGEIISDNGKQFRDDPFKDWCEKLCIRQHFASIKHPQTNGLVERANRSLGEGIKARLDARKAVILAEIGMPTRRTSEVDLVGNNEALEINLDLLEERREEASIRKAKCKAKMEKYYNSKVRNTSFKPGDLVYHNNDASWWKTQGS
nr:reverse transcriptase domain-containing protein [Tanacetum cinerariifolium]